MSVADIMLNIGIWIIQNTLLKMPTSISALPLATLQANINTISTFMPSMAVVNYLIPVDWFFYLFGAIIVAEIAMNIGWKGIKFILNFFRGSGG